jgi:GAF domain-containing protein
MICREEIPRTREEGLLNPAPPSPLIADCRQLLLDMAWDHSLMDLLRLIVGRLGESPRVALARIWLAQPAKDCIACVTAAECRGQSECLHQVASAGRSIVDDRDCIWVEGAFCRFPLGVSKIGRIAATGEPIELTDLSADLPTWLADPEWMRAEGVSGFGGQPLLYRGQVLGVLAVFARCVIGPDCMDWMRTVANHAAAAIATARAFERIEELKQKLEQENEYLREEETRAGRSAHWLEPARRLRRSSARSTRWPRRMRRYSCSARAVRARSSSPARSISEAGARQSR